MMGHKHKHSHAPDFYTAARFTSDDLGKLFLFRDRCTGTLYTFELLDCVTKSVAELDALLIDEYNLRPDVAVEQIWCRVTPSDFDRERLILGFDESYSDIYTEDAERIFGPRQWQSRTETILKDAAEQEEQGEQASNTTVTPPPFEQQDN